VKRGGKSSQTFKTILRFISASGFLPPWGGRQRFRVIIGFKRRVRGKGKSGGRVFSKKEFPNLKHPFSTPAMGRFSARERGKENLKCIIIFNFRIIVIQEKEGKGSSGGGEATSTANDVGTFIIPFPQ
jgi:hypothetical protein